MTSNLLYVIVQSVLTSTVIIFLWDLNSFVCTVTPRIFILKIKTLKFCGWYLPILADYCLWYFGKPQPTCLEAANFCL